MALVTMREALNQALSEEMLRDKDVFLMGEEVGEYQGAYKVTKGLLEELGPKRVIDTRITELGFAGLGVGAAMAGLRPIVEFMTFNFSILATDQIINSAAKMLYMSGGQFKIPIVFRGPGGSAYQVSSQHSQAIESWYAYFPGLKVVMPSTPADAKGLLKSAIRDDDPVIFIEQERMYGMKGEVPEDEDFTIPLGVAEIKREGTDATIVARSLMVPAALRAAEELEKSGDGNRRSDGQGFGEHGRGGGVSLVEERGRQGFDGRTARRNRHRQGDHGNAGAGERRAAQDSDRRRRKRAAGTTHRDHRRRR